MRFLPVLLFLLTACGTTHPPKKIRLPPVLHENSGLVIQGDSFHWHNDSGDGPYLYRTDTAGRLTKIDTLDAAAIDYEDLTTDPQGRFYVADTGNNRGRRTSQSIYRYDPATGQTDSIQFKFPGQFGRGRRSNGSGIPPMAGSNGEHDTEAMVYYRQYLHLFTKDQLRGKGNLHTYHFRVPAQPGTYEAELVDSLYLPRRVVTAAALDSVRGELVLTAYNFRLLAGFLPSSGASLITLTDFPEGRFLRGTVHRQNLSWLIPTQYEAVDFYDNEWLYVSSEGTIIRRRGVARRKRRLRGN